MFRYSDFVVHEINKEGKTLRLDDLSVPVEVEVRWGHSSLSQHCIIRLTDIDILKKIYIFSDVSSSYIEFFLSLCSIEHTFNKPLLGPLLVGGGPRTPARGVPGADR